MNLFFYFIIFAQGAKLISESQTSCIAEMQASQDSACVLIGVPPDGKVKCDGGEVKDIVWMRGHRVARVMVTPDRYRARKVEISWKKSQTPVSSFQFSNPLYENMLKRHILNYEASKNWISSPQYSKLTNSYGPPGICKLIIDKEGIYRIRYEDIIKIVPEIASVPPQNIKITNRGFEVPILVQGEENGSFGSGDWIEFYGEPIKGDNSYLNLYTSQNVYWLNIDGRKGARLVKKPGVPGSAAVPDSYQSQIHYENDSLYALFKEVPDTLDPWFWASFGSSKDFTIETPVPLKTEVCSLTINMYAVGSGGEVDAYMNNNSIGKVTFAGVEGVPISLNAVFQQNILEDTNKITLVPTSGNEIYLNSMDLKYTKEYKAVDGRIKFKASSNGISKFELTGFPNEGIETWQVGTAVFVGGKIDTSAGGYKFIFQDTTLDSSFYYAQDYQMSPIMVRDTSAGLASTSNQGEYLIITAPTFRANAERIANLRATQGFICKVVTTQDIYDEFNFGIPDVQAIKTFLTYAYEKWAAPPVAVLLLGDASYDHRNILGDNEDIVPTMSIYDVTLVLIPSDNEYACVNGDDPIPDMLIGRLPVKDAREFEIVYNKLATPFAPGDWRDNILFTSMDSQEGLIGESEKLIQDVMLPYYKTTRIYYPFQTRLQFIDAINKGTPFITYIGHSGPREWSGGLLWREDIPQLMNVQRLPFVAMLGCYNANFDIPGEQYMGETFIKSPGGAIAYWGSSGGTSTYNIGLVKGPLQDIITNRKEPVGMLSLEGIIQCFEDIGNSKTIDQQVLLGDPGYNFSFPRNIEVKLLPYSLFPGDSCVVSASLPAQIQGNAEITLYINDTTEYKKFKTPFSNGNVKASFVLSDTFKNQEKGKISLYVSTDTADFTGITYFSINKANIEISTNPSLPASIDSVAVKAKVFDRSGIKWVRCNWKTPLSLWAQIDMAPDTGGLWVATSKIPPQKPGTKVSLKVLLQNTNNEIFSEDTSYTVLLLPDLTLKSEMNLDGTDSVVLIANIVNNGEAPADSFETALYSIDFLNDTVLLGKPLLSLKGSEEKSVSVSWNLKVGEALIMIDPNNRINEGNETNNIFSSSIPINLFNATPSTGTKGWVKSLNSQFKCLVPAGAISRNTVVELKDTTALPDSVQSKGIICRFREKEAVLNDSMTIMLHPDSLMKKAIYRWCDGYKCWLLVSTDTITKTKKIGIFSLIPKKDTIPPNITLNIPDKIRYQARDKFNLKVSAIISDPSGIDIVDRGITITIDNDTVSDSNYTYPTDEQSLFALPLNCLLILGPGTHYVSFIAYDFHGNRAVKTVEIIVETPFGAMGNWGNYPDPARKNGTTFHFEFTDVPDAVGLQIYTISGRLIRTVNLNITSSIVEYYWNLTADNGEECANGAYFYKVYASRQNIKISRLFKLAILR